MESVLLHCFVVVSVVPRLLVVLVNRIIGVDVEHHDSAITVVTVILAIKPYSNGNEYEDATNTCCCICFCSCSSCS